MKHRKQDIELEVEKTLAYLDQAERIEPSPWFTSRLQARINTLESEPELSGFSGWGRLLLKPALVALIVVLNLSTAFMAIQYNGNGQEGRMQSVADLASDYGITYTDSFFGISEQYKE